MLFIRTKIKKKTQLIQTLHIVTAKLVNLDKRQYVWTDTKKRKYAGLCKALYSPVK